MRKLHRILYLEHGTNEYVLNKVESLMGLREPLPVIVMRWKVTWLGHVVRHDSLYKTIMHGTIDGIRRWCKRWTVLSLDNVREWMSVTIPHILAKAADRLPWRKTSFCHQATWQLLQQQWQQSCDWWRRMAVSDLVVRNCCMARMVPGEAELVSDWTCLPGGEV